MSGKFTSSVYGMPFRKNPRDGQREVFETVIRDADIKSINVKLPTGYGKSFVNAGCYSILKKQNRVNRLLVIVPTTAQREQYSNDGPDDFRDACLDGSVEVCDVALEPDNAWKHHRMNTRQIYIVTIQSLITTGKSFGGEPSPSATMAMINKMMQTGNWMVTVDEYHHYGVDKSWGRSVVQLPYQFLLAMSATPYRATDDSAFGKPSIVVTYREAVKDNCVKPLCGHSYTYKIDAVLEGGDVKTYTTDEFVKDVGSCSPDAIQRHVIEKKMRWSPKYVSPLVSYPIDRMISERLKTGHKLQAIVGAMCVSHAEMVCKQIKTMYPELEVDWVGTGNNGRSPSENAEVLSRFCPKKDDHGRRQPTLDILVHVGMAGEGLDSVNVSEVVHLNKAAINNSNNQENGRAARYLPGVVGNINFDSSSEYAKREFQNEDGTTIVGYLGENIMDAMDNLPPTVKDPENPGEPGEYEPMPDEPTIQIWNLELAHIDSGSPEVRRMAHVLADHVAPSMYGIEDFKKDLENPESKLYEHAIQVCREMRDKECRESNERSQVFQTKDQVEMAVRKVTGLVIAIYKGKQERFEKSLPGDIKKKINMRKKFCIGEVKNDVETLVKHYKWVKALEQEIIKDGLPQWLLL